MSIISGEYNGKIADDGIKNWESNLYEIFNDIVSGKMKAGVARNELSKAEKAFNNIKSFYTNDKQLQLQKQYEAELNIINKALKSGRIADVINQESISKLLHKEIEIPNEEVVIEQEETQEKTQETKVTPSKYTQIEIVNSKLDEFEKLKVDCVKYLEEFKGYNEKLDENIEQDITSVQKENAIEHIKKLNELKEKALDLNGYFRNGSIKFSKDAKAEDKEKFFSDKANEILEFSNVIGCTIDSLDVYICKLDTDTYNIDEFENVEKKLLSIKENLESRINYFKKRYEYYDKANLKEKLDVISGNISDNEYLISQIDNLKNKIESEKEKLNEKESTVVSEKIVEEENTENKDKIKENNESIEKTTKSEEVKNEFDDKEKNVDYNYTESEMENIVSNMNTLEDDNYFDYLLSNYDEYRKGELDEKHDIPEEPKNSNETKVKNENSEVIKENVVEEQVEESKLNNESKKEEIKNYGEEFETDNSDVTKILEENLEEAIDEFLNYEIPEVSNFEELEEEIEAKKVEYEEENKENENLDLSEALETELEEILNEENNSNSLSSDESEEINKTEENETVQRIMDLVKDKDISSKRSIQKEINNIYDEMLDSKRNRGFFSRGKSRPYGDIKEEVFLDIRKVFAKINMSSKFLEEPYADEFALKMFKGGVPQYMQDNMDEKLKSELDEGMEKYSELVEKGTFTDIEKENFEKYVIQPYLLKKMEPKEKGFLEELKENTVSQKDIAKTKSHASREAIQKTRSNKVK